MIARRATIGILGDGQLGRMLAQAAQRRGFVVHGFGQNTNSPLAQVTNCFTEASFEDVSALSEFAGTCDVVTSEFENVSLVALQTAGCKPSAHIFSIAQDRLKEKESAMKAGLSPAPYYSIDCFEDLKSALCKTNGEGILKTRRLGYDGKGQWRISSATDLAELWKKTPKAELILEGLISFKFETSVLVARNSAGDVITFPCGENIHREGILHQSVVPGKVTKEIQERAQRCGTDLANSLKLEGLLAIEFFVLGNGELVFNEMAPRPHNSGHWTIEACDQSQFDLAISAILSEPLREPVQLANAIMTNVLGEDILTPETRNKCYWHDYGKQTPKVGRKMGHITELLT